MGALTQAPRHSTSVQENKPSGVTWPGSPISLRQVSLIASAPLQPARRRAADLHVIAADGRQIEHGVEGRDLVDADIGHAEHVGDIAERGLGQPAAHLLLRAPQQRQHGRGLPPFRIFLDLGLGPFEIFRREGEALRLLGGEAADAHRLASSFLAAVWPSRREALLAVNGTSGNRGQLLTHIGLQRIKANRGRGRLLQGHDEGVG